MTLELIVTLTVEEAEQLADVVYDYEWEANEDA